ncbi:MAG TPA: hypothetical protein VK625_23630 [Flavitalea sp.]|nr:hypothetical protein [Flavitalea sp.]
MKVVFMMLLVLPMTGALAQEGEWNKNSHAIKLCRIQQIADTIRKSNNHEQKADALTSLFENYLLEQDSLLAQKMESLLIGISYFSNQYFYHLFELHFVEFFNSNEGEILAKGYLRVKVAKVVLILSCRNSKIDPNYYDKALSIFNSTDIRHLECKNISTEVDNFNKVELNNNLMFFEMLYNCPEKVDIILRLRLRYFLMI